MEVVEEDYILSLHCHHRNDFCIKMGSDESHFNVSLTVKSKVTRQCLKTTTFEEKGEPKRIQTEAPLLTRRPSIDSRPYPATWGVGAGNVTRENNSTPEQVRSLCTKENKCRITDDRPLTVFKI